MNKCTLYAWLYMATLLLLAGCLCEWATPLGFGGMSYGCAEELGLFTSRDAVKVFVSAVVICALGISGIHFVLRKCATAGKSNTNNTGDETI